MAADHHADLPDLSSWIESRQLRGLYFFTSEEALKALQRSEAAFKQAVARLAKKRRIARIHWGFFIIIPFENDGKILFGSHDWHYNHSLFSKLSF